MCLITSALLFYFKNMIPESGLRVLLISMWFLRSPFKSLIQKLRFGHQFPVLYSNVLLLFFNILLNYTSEANHISSIIFRLYFQIYDPVITRHACGSTNLIASSRFGSQAWYKTQMFFFFFFKVS